MSVQYNLLLNSKVHFLGWMPTSSMDQICNTLATNCKYVGLTAYGAGHLSFMPFHFFHCRSWILTTLPTGQWHMLIGWMESGIQSHMQHKMSHRQHWQQFRQFEPHLTVNATFKYHSFRMFWIYVFNIVPQDWDLQVYHMIVGAHISVVAAWSVNARTNWFHSLLLQARSLFQSSKCSTVVQSLTLQAVDFLAGNYLSRTCQQWWSELVKLCLLFALMGLDQYLVYYTTTNYLKAGAQVVGKLSYIGH
jgi:hypothetical protein